ncbi:unnamed protein product, partial [Meganyctiphanes norvegica]
MAFVLDEYAPRKFSDKYEKYLAPSGQLWTPEKVFTNKRLGPDGEENLKKAFKITIKKLKKMRQLCANCGQKEGKLKFCKGCNALMYCSDECMEKRQETHERVCDDLRKEIIDQLIRAIIILFSSLYCFSSKSAKKKSGIFIKKHCSNLSLRIHVRGDILINNYFTYLSLTYHFDIFRKSCKCPVITVYTMIYNVCYTIQIVIGGKHAFVRLKLKLHLMGYLERSVNQDKVLAVDQASMVSSRCVGRPMVVTLVAPNIEKYPETRSWTPDNPHQITPSVKCIAYTGLYHEFWAEHIETQNIMKKMERPNVCMAIHPGVHTEDMFELWVPTLDLLQKERVPLVMTTYSRYEFEETMELKMDEMYQNVTYKGENPLGSQHTKQTPHEPDHVWASNSFLIAIDNAKDLFDEAEEDNLSE